jgi:putative heme-binding domain-containing protein
MAMVRCPIFWLRSTPHRDPGGSAAWALALCLMVGTLRAEETVEAVARIYEQTALTTAGDPRRGRRWYFDEKLTRCSICHKLDGQGGDVGPDLSAIGGKFARPHLIESLLEPSRQIVEGFRSSVLRLRSGQVATGIVRGESAEHIALVDADGKTQILALAEIEERRASEISLMPDGLIKSLTPEQFTDVIAFLETLRSGGKGTPGSTVEGAIGLPEGFRVEIVATGLTGCTALETTADQRVLICEQTGTLRVVKQGQLLAQPALTLDVDPTWERGLIGVTVDPDFPRSPYVYLCYVAPAPYPHHRISRFTMQGDVVDPQSELRLLEGDDQTKLGGTVPAGHQGGALHFGPDGKLYVAIGEQTAGKPSQDLQSLLGKMLRINRDGSIPEDNPFFDQTRDKYRAIWAIGLRNQYTFAIRESNGDMCINDIGSDKFEEINRGVAGGNYGWPLSEGPSDDPRFLSPIFFYPRASVCGGDFSDSRSPWPAAYRGRYFFAEYIHGWIKTLDVDHPQDVATFVTGLRNPVDLRFAPDGSLYVLLRNAWVMDGKFQPGTGSLLRIDRAAAD